MIPGGNVQNYQGLTADLPLALKVQTSLQFKQDNLVCALFYLSFNSILVTNPSIQKLF